MPQDMMPDLNKAKIEIVNYHVFQRRKAHLRNNIVYHCFKFLQCDSEEPCE